MKPHFTEKWALANELDTLWGIVNAGDDYHARWFKIEHGKAYEIGVSEYILAIKSNGVASIGYNKEGVSEVVSGINSPSPKVIGKSIHWFGDKMYKDFTLKEVKYLQLTERAIHGRYVSYDDMVLLFNEFNKQAYKKSSCEGARHLAVPTWEFEWERIKNK